MAEPQTVNCGIIVPNTGDLPGTWGSAAVNPDFVAIDGYLGGVQTIAVTAGSVTLTSPAGFIPTPSGGPTQSQNAVIKVTGSLTGQVSIGLPLPGMITVHNLTNNAFAVLVVATGGLNEIGIPPGNPTRIYNDGSSCYYVDFPQVGSLMDLCTATVPAWIANSSPAPFLLCDGSAFSGVTYPYLTQLIGANTPDLRGRSRSMLNLGTNRITTAVSGINGDALFGGGGDQNTMAHTHGVVGTTGSENANHTHTLNGGAAFTVGVSSVGNGNASPGAAGPAAAISPTTSIESAVHQHAVNFASQVFGAGTAQNMPPTTIHGITLIRAA